MLADIGLGIFVALIASNLFGIEVSAQLAGISVLFALLPDADFLVHAIAHRKVGGKYAHVHRDLFHYPLLYLGIGGVFAALFGAAWFFVFMAASLAHFIHDSMGIGWGIKWMYPFSKKISKLFSTKEGDLSMNASATWSEKELEKVAEEKGNEHWIRDVYFRWHPVGVIENVVFIVAIVTLLYVIYG
ncbi:MAG: hypothetical protein UT41_C0003G0104 [Candidatus Wolfebacteria bacterium GW2011_GWC2_39_22]|uniref:Membrane-bound metal-dependent hydrolase n=1 Tax=Candidatus Wolfebacteria bacterium GW2011_GWC2_39_22 TaxID=1619013 RepID=A0A0G0REW7_9BACT|nr:MAG: hypothetical protein UT41_C0003G0104 [Candidatus Wolfebacteria bacterium GW2011_GWC2_39_22]HBI25204.1 hypothetical protein [Candidatus Wolfebacteria bacterium]